MTPQRERYQKLPGHLRGIVRGASAWLGPDHVLLVRSLRISESYKRFYLRDVQAIVVARAPRFHLSVRCFGIAALWLAAFLWASRFGNPRAALALAIAGAGLIGAWLYISAACSCRCRIFTAVSGEELPSVYRSWTARRFLERVTPRIAEVQGTLDGKWVEAADELSIGPGPGAPGREKPDRPNERPRTPVSDLFIASLLVSAAVTLLTLRVPDSRRWLPLLFQLCKTAAAIAVLVQFRNGLLNRTMHWLAVAALVATGVIYYVHVAFHSVNGVAVTVNYINVQKIGAAVSGILGLVGGAVSLRRNG